MDQNEKNGGILTQYQTYGWAPDTSLSDDENMMDLVLLVTRSSKLKQGSMACILLSPPKIISRGILNDPLLDRIISIANNQELYRPDSSDIHAEIAAIGAAAQSGRSTTKATAYITMPPCKNCFAALVAAGIKRIVSIHQPPARYYDISQRLGVEIVGVENSIENRTRVDSLVSSYYDSLAAE